MIQPLLEEQELEEEQVGINGSRRYILDWRSCQNLISRRDSNVINL
jgi:hypothetical protein